MSENKIIDVEQNLEKKIPDDQKVIYVHIYKCMKTGRNMICLKNCDDETVYWGFIHKNPKIKYEIMKIFKDYEFYNNIYYSNHYKEPVEKEVSSYSCIIS